MLARAVKRQAKAAIMIHDRYAGVSAANWILAWAIALAIGASLGKLDLAAIASLAFAVGAIGIAALLAYKNKLSRQIQEANSPTYQVRVNEVSVGVVTQARLASIMDIVMQDNTVCVDQILNICKAARRLAADVLIWLSVSTSCSAMLAAILVPEHLVGALVATVAMKPNELQQASSHLLTILQAAIGFLVIARIWMGPTLGLANKYRQELQNGVRVDLKCPASGEMTLIRCDARDDYQSYTQHAV